MGCLCGALGCCGLGCLVLRSRRLVWLRCVMEATSGRVDGELGGAQAESQVVKSRVDLLFGGWQCKWLRPKRNRSERSGVGIRLHAIPGRHEPRLPICCREPRSQFQRPGIAGTQCARAFVTARWLDVARLRSKQMAGMQHGEDCPARDLGWCTFWCVPSRSMDASSSRLLHLLHNAAAWSYNSHPSSGVEGDVDREEVLAALAAAASAAFAFAAFAAFATTTRAVVRAATATTATETATATTSTVADH